jgi:alpha-1,2-mannosyltransferase
MSSGTISAPRPKRAVRTRQEGLRRAAEHSLFGVVPVVATLALIVFQFRIHAVAIDFHVAYWPAADRLIHGLSPYVVTPRQITGGTAFVYPALSALVFAPFALLSRGIAQVLYMLVCIACVPATLRVLNVRDWRVYGVAMLWLPVFVGWQSGNVTLPLALMVALTWRYRDRPLIAALLTAAAISLKPFVWPLGVWLLATRRWKASAYAVAWGVAINLLAWGLVGFSDIHAYLHLSSEVTDALWHGGYSMLAVAHHIGLTRAAGESLLLGGAALLAVIVVYLGAVKRRETDAFVLTVVLMLVASPLLWSHYFALLLVPVALRRPRLSPVWALPLLMWPMPPRQPVFGWEELLAWGVTTAMLVSLLRGSRRGPAT